MANPLFKNGIAASASESKYPHLWDSLALMWVPSVGPQGGSLIDYSGNSRTGAYFNLSDSNLSDDGIQTNGTNSYVRGADFTYGPKFTIMTKLKINSNAGNDYMYFISHGSFGSQNGIGAHHPEDGNADNGKIRTAIRDNDDTQNNFALDVSEDLDDGESHFYALQVGAFSGNGSQVFVDGVVRATDATRGGGSFNPSTNIFWGMREDLNSERGWNGWLDDFRIYSRTLSADEIASVNRGEHPLIRRDHAFISLLGVGHGR